MFHFNIFTVFRSASYLFFTLNFCTSFSSSFSSFPFAASKNCWFTPDISQPKCLWVACAPSERGKAREEEWKKKGEIERKQKRVRLNKDDSEEKLREKCEENKG